KPEDTATILHQYLDHLQNDDHMGIPIGIKKVDDFLVPIQDSDFTTILGRPSNGKSVLTVHYARQAATQYREQQDKYAPPVLISLESPVEEIMLRNLANYTAIDSKIIRTGKYTNDWTALHEATD